MDQAPPFSAVARTTDAELRLVAALRRAARERGGPLPSIDVADALLDERRKLTQGAATAGAGIFQSLCE
jgi:hypothetical protein